MKKFLFLFAVVLATLQMSAADVTSSQAQAAANAFISKQVKAGSLNATAANNLKLVKAEASVAKPTAVDYYIFNTDNSYVVVAGDDQAPMILMYGEEGALDLDNIPPAMQWLLNQYKYQIDGLKAGTRKPIEAPILSATAVPPLVKANWDQDAPYNNQCPTSGGRRALTGCPATSLAMCFYKWKWPTTFPALPAISSSSSGGYSAPALPAREADWDNIIDEYTGPSNYSYNSTEANAVAWLMRYVGQDIPDYMYGYDASGANDPEILEGCHNMGYTDAEYLLLTELVSSGGWWGGYSNGPQHYTDAEWSQFMLNELYNGRPIEYLAYDYSGYQLSGHAFNVFGCNSSGQFYVNWGWSGDSNGYCTLHNFTTATGATGQSGSYVFNYGEAMIIGIAPPGNITIPELTVDPTSLAFTGCSTGETYTKTFTVSGTDLNGNVNITSSSGTFTVSPTTLTAEQAEAGATITVTYKPTSSGTQNGTITISSTGAASKTVSVSGTATTTPKITVDPTTISMSTAVGTPVTQTFSVKGTNLTSTVFLTCSGTGFSINKTNITRAAANNGTTVTVTYNPTTSGTHTGTVTLTSTGAETVTVSLNGTAAGNPTIVANPTSLSFTANVGETVTQTFSVVGTDLASNVLLSVSGAGFTIDKSNITRTAATNGTTVTVTYKPTTSGTHTGVVTLTSTGAEAVNVALNGTATTIPTLSAYPTSLDFVTTVGTPVTKSFELSAAYLEGNVTLAVQGEGFTIDKTNIIPGAANNAQVNVTYTPTAYGTHTGSVTITSPNVQPVTVTLNGQADLVKFAPVMLPANENYINLNRFRADWSDETPVGNVASYTLEVTAKSEPEPEPVLIGSLDGTQYSSNGYSAVTLTAPWGGNSVRGGYGVIYFRNRYNNSSTEGNITFTIPAGYENATFTMKITTVDNEEGIGNMSVSTPQTAAVNHLFAANETYSWLVTASTGQKITIKTPDDNYSPSIVLIEVYAGNATSRKLAANESGDALYRLITGITDKFYTVDELAAEGTFLYKVKAIYLDGTESDWSNIEEVTLFQNSLLGDVNRDGLVTVADVTDLIDYIGGLGNDIDLVAADVNYDGEVTIADVTGIIDMILIDNPAKMKKTMSVNRPIR